MDEDKKVLDIEIHFLHLQSIVVPMKLFQKETKPVLRHTRKDFSIAHLKFRRPVAFITRYSHGPHHYVDSQNHSFPSQWWIRTVDRELVWRRGCFQNFIGKEEKKNI